MLKTGQAVRMGVRAASRNPELAFGKALLDLLGTVLSLLPLLLAGFSAGFLMLRGRSYVDRWQAITLAGTAVLIVGAVVLRYALVLH